MLEGVFSDEHGDYPAGTYVRNPIGYSHASFTRDGCTILVKLRQMTDPSEQRLVVDTNAGEWIAASVPGLERLPLFDSESTGEKLVDMAIAENRFITDESMGGADQPNRFVTPESMGQGKEDERFELPKGFEAGLIGANSRNFGLATEAAGHIAGMQGLVDMGLEISQFGEDDDPNGEAHPQPIHHRQVHPDPQGDHGCPTIDLQPQIRLGLPGFVQTARGKPKRRPQRPPSCASRRHEHPSLFRRGLLKLQESINHVPLSPFPSGLRVLCVVMIE